MTELEELIAAADLLRGNDPDEKLGAIVDRINAIRNGAPQTMPATVEGDDAREPTEEEERAELIAAAERRGIKIDKRWSTERIIKALE